MSRKNRTRDYCPSTNPIAARAAGYGQVDTSSAVVDWPTADPTATMTPERLRAVLQRINPAHVRAVRYLEACRCWTCALQRVVLAAAEAWEADLSC